MDILGWSTYDEWKTTEPYDSYQEDSCPECGLGLAKCKCELEECPACHDRKVVYRDSGVDMIGYEEIPCPTCQEVL